VSEAKTALEVASIKQSCKQLHLPTMAGQCLRMAEQAVKEKQSHLTYLDALLEAEVEERERNEQAHQGSAFSEGENTGGVRF